MKVRHLLIKITQRKNGPRGFLHLIKKQERFPWNNRRFYKEREGQNKSFGREIFFKKRSRPLKPFKINFDKRFKLPPQPPNGICLSYLPCPSKKQGFSETVILPSV